MSTVAIDFNPMPKSGREVVIACDMRTSFDDGYKMDNNGGKFYNNHFKDSSSNHTIFIAHVGKYKNFSMVKGIVQKYFTDIHTEPLSILKWKNEQKVYNFLSKIKEYNESFGKEIDITDSEFIFGYKRTHKTSNESELYVWFFNDWSVMNLSDYYAMGSGRKYALAILENGGTPEEAVDIASRLDKSTGGDTQRYSLISNEKLKR